MDIQEMQERKSAMEGLIAKAVEDFERATGVTVGDSVRIKRMDITTAGDERRRYIITARTEVAL